MYEIFVQLCEKYGVTAYKVCKDLGLRPSTISNWKNRGNVLSTNYLNKIANYFNVSIDYMLNGYESVTLEGNSAEMFMKLEGLCNKNEISMQKLQKDLCLSSDWLTSGSTMPAEKLHEIAKYFNVPMEYLLGDNNVKSLSDEQDRYYMDDDARGFAQFLYDNPEYKVLFDASKKVKKEDLEKAIKMLGIFSDQ